jgi:ribose transport system ATP-binding protein
MGPEVTDPGPDREAPVPGRAPHDDLLRIEHLSKTFPGQKALDDMHLGLRPGEVHALVGPNGSGKSTLIKVLSGFHDADPGAEASWAGEPFELGSDGLASGRLRFVHQDLGLVAELNAIDNIALVHGYRHRTALGTINWRREATRVRAMLARLGVEDLDVRREVRDGTPVDRASIAIAGALEGLSPGEGVLVLDEPTASLPPAEVKRLFGIVRELVAAGTSVLYVSHRMDEIFEIADRVTVLREGRHVATREVAELRPRELSELLVGHKVEEWKPRERRVEVGAAGPVLSVSRLRSTFVVDVSFEVGAGEILGFAGLLGSGREEIPYAVAGALTPAAAGTFTIGGNEVRKLDPRKAQALGIAFVPADRAVEGSVADFNVTENITLPRLESFTRGGVIEPGRERAEVAEWFERLDIQPRVPRKPFPELSGGNQQKAVVARALRLEPSVLVLAEPTAGVDVGARQLIYQLVRDIADSGVGVLVSSSDVEDLISLCDRVIVLADGRAVDELESRQMTQANLLQGMEGAAKETSTQTKHGSPR